MDDLTVLLERALYKHKKGQLSGVDDLYKSLIGTMGESKVVNLTEGESVNGKFDVLGKTRYPGRIEVKTANKPTNGKLGAWSLKEKKGHCDWVALVDASGVQDSDYRVSVIPHDVFFDYFDNRTAKSDYVTWSFTYNESDNLSPEMTNLFLKYEVPIDIIRDL